MSGWDCHAHLFGPYKRFPLSSRASYTPPEAAEMAYFEMLSSLDLDCGVLVHPAAYGEDFALLFEALANNANLRGVIVARPDTLPTLAPLRSKGIRAARFNHRSDPSNTLPGSASFDDLLKLASALADAGLHAELWTDCKALPDIEARLRALPIPVVIDHMGGFDVTKGINDAGFRTLLSLVEGGKAWVKLCAYRNLLTAKDFELGLPFHEALLKANPTRLLWGSDWPHLRVSPAPDTRALLDMFKRWTGSEQMITQILEINPALLYQ